MIKCLGEEGPAAVDLHQGQVIQLKQKPVSGGSLDFRKLTLLSRRL